MNIPAPLFTLMCSAALSCSCLLGAPSHAAALAHSTVVAPEVQVDADGTVHVPAHVVPLSGMLSPEAKAYVTEHLLAQQRPQMQIQDGGVPRLLAGYLARERSFFHVDKRDTTLAGVHVFDFTSHEGVSAGNRDRVLINLHGGGFSGCWPACAELESLPVASHGRIRVVSIDYRQGPKYKFPAASEDVAAVYRELLKTYRPQNIGIYGCSAGGMLTGMAVAWFQRHELPAPGAIGVLCAGLSLKPAEFGGDAAYTTAAIGEARAPPAPPQPGQSTIVMADYFSNVSLSDPMVSPADAPDVLAKFPPTLIISGTRSMDLSSAVHTQRLLVAQGVEADLQIWEGMFHGFFYNIDVPESREAFQVLIRFFERHLGRS